MQRDVKWELADPAETLRLSSFLFNCLLQFQFQFQFHDQSPHAISFFHGICIAEECAADSQRYLGRKAHRMQPFLSPFGISTVHHWSSHSGQAQRSAPEANRSQRHPSRSIPEHEEFLSSINDLQMRTPVKQNHSPKPITTSLYLKPKQTSPSSAQRLIFASITTILPHLDISPRTHKHKTTIVPR